MKSKQSSAVCLGFLMAWVLCLPAAQAAEGGGHVDPALLEGHRYGPVRKEDNLRSIAWLMHRHHESIQQVMDELVMDNPDAFSAHGRTIKPGSYLERKSHPHAVVGALPSRLERKPEAGPDVAGYLHESDPVVRSEMPDNGFSPDIIPFQQALQDRKPSHPGSAPVSVPTSSAKNRKDVVAAIREDTSTNDPEDVITDISEDASANHREEVVTESDGGIWTGFLSGMLGGCLVMVLYIVMTRKGVITYSIGRHYPLTRRGEAETAMHHEEEPPMQHVFARPRHPDDPVTEPSEQDLLNWSRSLSAIQDTTRAEEDLSNRLSTSR